MTTTVKMSRSGWLVCAFLITAAIWGGGIWLGAATWDRISGGAATAHIASGADKSRPLRRLWPAACSAAPLSASSCFASPL